MRNIPLGRKGPISLNVSDVLCRVTFVSWWIFVKPLYKIKLVNIRSGII